MTDSRKLVARMQRFALGIIRLVDSLPDRNTGWVLGKQLLRSGTSIGANYRAAQRGRSKAEFISKLGVALEEADETCYWLELLRDSGMSSSEELEELLDEASQFTAILTTSIRRARED